ncbi:MAG TPA: CvpA family protein [Candidatus Angelobacter sp.]|nr:CvpA family protein [Candidatus Angelobacter sp.]
MNGLDWLILLIMLCSALLAAAQGFFFEVISLAGVVIGYLLAAWGYRRLAPWFLDYVKSTPVADLAGFLTIFLSVVIFAGVVARIARWMIHEAGLRWMDRALGAAFGFLRGMLIVTAALLAVTAFAPESHELAGSQLAPYFQVAGRGAIWLAPSEIRQKFRQGLEKLRGKAEPAVKK